MSDTVYIETGLLTNQHTYFLGSLCAVHNFSCILFQYIVEKHAKTLLPQYLGVYRITVDNKETYLLVMKSVFSSKFKIHKKYDLKGSTVDRQASSKEKVRLLLWF